MAVYNLDLSGEFTGVGYEAGGRNERYEQADPAVDRPSETYSQCGKCCRIEMPGFIEMNKGLQRRASVSVALNSTDVNRP